MNGPARVVRTEDGKLTDDVLGVLLRHVDAVATGPRRPRRVRLETGGVAVEVEWDPVDEPSRSPSLEPVPAAPAQIHDDPDGSEPGSAPPPDGHVITAGNVGVYHHALEPGAPPFVVTGDEVTDGQQVGIIEAMKLMIPVCADRAGRVTDVRCKTGTSVEFGTPLIVLDVGGR